MKLISQSSSIGWAAALALAFGLVSIAGAQSKQHGRNWKPLPPTAHVVVTVVKGFNDKPLPNAAVVFHAVRNGRDDGNLEVKTDRDGNATIDVIEVGSNVEVQVIADGFATYAQNITVDGPSKSLTVKLLRPRAQVSEYSDNDGEPAQVKPGIQEPSHTAPVAPKAASTQPPSPQPGLPQ